MLARTCTFNYYGMSISELSFILALFQHKLKAWFKTFLIKIKFYLNIASIILQAFHLQEVGRKLNYGLNT